MIAVVVDTNILTQSPKLSRNDWASLAENKDDWEVTLMIPEVVMMETTKVVPRTWENEQKALKKARIGTFGLQDDLNAMVQRIQDHIDGYEAQLTERMSELGVQLVPTPNVPHSEIAFRASRGTAPYHAGDKDGYRDTLIWLTVLEVATTKPDHEVWFVSDNTNDFGDPAVKRKQEEKEDASQLPRELHPHLKEELENRGLQDRVKYATSLEALEQHIASMHGPISADDLQELIDTVNLQDLGAFLNMQPSTVVDAAAAALNPRFDHGVVNQLLPQDKAWGFSDAAYRGGDRWTANYSVDVDASLLAFTSNPNQIPYVVEKPLRVSGTVAFTKQGQPQALQVSRIEALPDDPDRALWSMVQAARFTVPDFQWPLDASVLGSMRAAAGMATEWKLSEEQAETFSRIVGMGKLSEEQTETFRRAANMASWKPSEEQLETFRRAVNMASWKPSEEQLETFRRAHMARGVALSDEAAQAIDNAVGNINEPSPDNNLTGEQTTPDEDEPETKG